MARFGVLGEITIEVADTTVPLRPLQRRLLACLILARGQVVAVDRLAELMWPGALPANPERSLHTSVYRLRKKLGDEDGEIVRRVGGGYQLAVAHDAIDAARFETLAARSADATTPGDRLAATDEALALWRAEIPYLDFAGDPLFEPEVARLVELRLRARESRWDATLELGGHDSVIGEIEAALEAHPHREHLYAILMRALHGAGRQRDALAVYQRVRNRLGEDVGLEPSPQLAELEERIAADDPALRSAASRSTTGTNLPVRLASVVGRDHDIANVSAMVREHRSVTVVGPGGVGKTTVAIEAARTAAAAGVGDVWLVPLADVTSPDMLVAHVLTRLGDPRDRHDQRVDDWEAGVDVLIDEISDGPVLLVLDGCEHLLPDVARMATRMLEACPNLRTLATSRVRLDAAGEAIYALAPLTTTAEASSVESALVESSALRLLDQRAREVDPGFAVDDESLPVALRICRRLDGLPLAIELAAAYAMTLSLQEIDEQLDRRFELLRSSRGDGDRHRSLATAIGWSFDLLDASPRRLLLLMSTMRGAFTLSDVARLSGLDRVEVANLLLTLHARSLLHVDRSGGPETTYSLLESVRDYAHSALIESGGAGDAMRAHASAITALCGDARAHIAGGRSQAAIVDRLARSIPDINQAVDTLLATDDFDTALEAVTAIRWLWMIRERQPEGYRLVSRVIDSAPDEASSELAAAHVAAGVLAFMSGGAMTAADITSRARRHFHLADRIAEELGLVAISNEMAVWNGYYLYYHGDLLGTFSRAELGAGTGDPFLELYSRFGMAALANLGGDNERGRREITRAIDLAVGVEDLFGEAIGRCVAGALARDAGDHEASLAEYAEAEKAATRIGAPLWRLVAVSGQAIALALLGELDVAEKTAGLSVDLAAGSARRDALRYHQHLMVDADIGVGAEELEAWLDQAYRRHPARRPAAALGVLLQVTLAHAALRRHEVVATTASQRLAEWRGGEA